MAARSSRNAYLLALGAAIRTRREKLGLSQETMGFEADVHRTYVGGVERGERNPTVLTMLKIAGVLKTTPAQILRDAER